MPTTLAVAVEAPEVGALKLVVPGPLVCVHCPVPAVGVLPPKDAVVNVPHKFCVPPTVAVVGLAFLVIITLSKFEQAPLAIVQRKVFAPTPRVVMPDVGDPGVVIVPAPLIKVQVPVPTVAVLPASVAVVAQTV